MRRTGIILSLLPLLWLGQPVHVRAQVLSFPQTRIDTFNVPLRFDLTLDHFSTEQHDSLVITAASFQPDSRVFSVEEIGGSSLPWVIHHDDTLRLKFTFRPRAPKNYAARLALSISSPAATTDTSIALAGSGFAPAFGVGVAFDIEKLGGRTVRLAPQDTLELPVILERDFPQSLIDIGFLLRYERTSLRLLDIRSPHTMNVTVQETGEGARASLMDVANATKGELTTIRFLALDNTTKSMVALDHFEFDSDSIIYYDFIATNDSIEVMIESVSSGVVRTEQISAGRAELSSYPDPFISATTIQIELIEPGQTRLVLMTPEGREVRLLCDRWLDAGNHRFQVTDDLPSGTYLCVLHSGGERVVKTIRRVR